MITKVLGDFTTMIDINVARMEKYGHNVNGPPIRPPVLPGQKETQFQLLVRGALIGLSILIYLRSRCL